MPLGNEAAAAWARADCWLPAPPAGCGADPPLDPPSFVHPIPVAIIALPPWRILGHIAEGGGEEGPGRAEQNRGYGEVCGGKRRLGQQARAFGGPAGLCHVSWMSGTSQMDLGKAGQGQGRLPVCSLVPPACQVPVSGPAC